MSVDDEIYTIEERDDGFWITTLMMTCGPFGSLKKARKDLFEMLKKEPERKIIEQYNSKGNLIKESILASIPGRALPGHNGV
jgi:hypothetical protein